MGAASAATITETASFGPVATPFDGQVLPIQQFDPSLGILNSIEFIVTASTSGNATITNDSGNDGFYKNTIITTTMTLFDPLGTALVSAAPQFVDVSLFVLNGQTKNTGNIFGTPITKSATIAIASVFNGPDPYTIAESSTGSATVQVVYNYSVVPEPSTVSLTALAGFGLF